MVKWKVEIQDELYCPRLGQSLTLIYTYIPLSSVRSVDTSVQRFVIYSCSTNIFGVTSGLMTLENGPDKIIGPEARGVQSRTERKSDKKGSMVLFTKFHTQTGTVRVRLLLGCIRSSISSERKYRGLPDVLDQGPSERPQQTVIRRRSQIQ